MLVATLKGRAYYNIVTVLKSMGLKFDSVTPEEAASINSQLVITTEQESGIVGKKNILLDQEMDDEPALVRAKILKNLGNQFQDDELVIGVDPGKRIGIAVFYMHREIDSQVLTSVRKSIDLISAIIIGTRSRKKIVRIGYGDPMMAEEIADKLHMKFGDNIAVEFVNEHGTSNLRATGSNGKGMRDKLSARVIALRKGRRFKPLIPIEN